MVMYRFESEMVPPMHTKLVICFLIRFSAARSRPERSRKSLQRAEPIIVPQKGERCILMNERSFHD